MAALANPFDTVKVPGTGIPASSPLQISRDMQAPATIHTVTPGAQIPSASRITDYPQHAQLSQKLAPGSPAFGHPISSAYITQAQNVIMGDRPTKVAAPSMNGVQAPAQMPVLPPAYGQYAYGERMVRWSGRVPVPEDNTGIMRNAEFPTKPHHEGVEVAGPDYAVRNMTWRHSGPWAGIKPADKQVVLLPLDQDPSRETADMKSRRLAQAYYNTKELVPYYGDYEPFRSAPPDFKALKAARDGPLAGLTLGKTTTIDIIGDEQLAEFFADPEASLEDNIDL